jgi:hypothetical protein
MFLHLSFRFFMGREPETSPATVAKAENEV